MAFSLLLSQVSNLVLFAFLCLYIFYFPIYILFLLPYGIQKALEVMFTLYTFVHIHIL